MYLNPSLPRVLGQTEPIDCSQVKPCFIKYARYEFVLDEVEPPIQEVLMQMAKHLSFNHRFVLADIKIRDFKAGEHTCIPGWHIDSVTDPRHDSLSENHLIWIQGTPTEFVSQPVHFPAECSHFSQVIDGIPEDNVFKVEQNTIYQYDRTHLHRGPQVRQDHRRVLIRLTETSKIQPIPYKAPR